MEPKQCSFKLCLGLVASWSAVSLSIPTDHPQFIGMGADCSCHQPHVNQGSNARYDEVKDQLAAADILIGISSTVITPPGPGELSVTVGIIRTWTQSVTQQETLDIRAANEPLAKFSQITEKAPTWAFSWLTLLRHYAKHAPVSCVWTTK